MGIVLEVGDDVTNFAIGDRVVSNGPHAEIVNVQRNLVVKVPKTVENENAIFTVVGSISLQGVRLFHPTIGEKVVVIGLGLIGLMTCQILKANGVNVIGVDIDKKM